MLRTDNKRLTVIALTIAFLQFTNALEYMVFNPVFTFMAPDFSVPVTWSGYITGIYTLAAVISGVGAFLWVDKLNKKRLLVTNMALLGMLTLAITATSSFSTLLVLRLMAGFIGGTTMGVGIGLMINLTPPAQRAKVLATVLASFSVVSIIGMPAVLFICSHFHWHLALGVIGLLCFISSALVMFFVPQEPRLEGEPHRLKVTPELLLFASATGLAQFSPMLIIPVLVPLLIQRMQAAEGNLAWLFLLGGIAGLLATKLTGKLANKYSAFCITLLSGAFYLAAFTLPLSGSAAGWLFMVIFISTSYCRLVASSVVSIRYPKDEWRAGFNSLQTAIMHLLTALAFFIPAIIFPATEMTTRSLNQLLLLAAASSALLPPFIWLLENRLKKTESARQYN